MKISLKDIKRLLAPCSDAISLSICYTILLVLACSVFWKPTHGQIYIRGFELFFHSALASTMINLSWMLSILGRQVSINCKSMQHVHTRPVVSLLIQIAVENQCNKKAHGNPLRILNLPFGHSHNSLRVYCASQIFYLHLTTIPCESIAHPKVAHNNNSLRLVRKSDWMPL